LTVDTEAEVRLHAIERWVDHAQSGACPTRMALEAIEALAAVGLAYDENERATMGVEESGPGDVVSVSPGPGPTPEWTGADVNEGTRYTESSASRT
jgi:hypothetical protein